MLFTLLFAECPLGPPDDKFLDFVYNASCYMLSLEAESWNAARIQCQKLAENYSLVTIHNDDENAALVSEA